MPLLEEPNCCAICGRHISGHSGLVPLYFCPNCFSRHKEDILARAPWAFWLLAEEKARRKRRNRLIRDAGLPRLISGAYPDEGALGREKCR
mgnify:CR=1 FL=1